MTLRLMYVTGDPDVARLAQDSGVDWVFVDLESIGKRERQGHLDTVISKHTVEDVRAVRAVLDRARLLVRVDPLNPGSSTQIDEVIDSGADIVMLPYFHTARQAAEFVQLVDGRAEVCLLVETREAEEAIDEVVLIQGVDYVHIGLNDLHLDHGATFMFELLADGTVEHLCRRIEPRGITYGFGGIGRMGAGDLRAESIVGEHYRLGSSMVILSRSFCDMRTQDAVSAAELFSREVGRIRGLESVLAEQDVEYFERNRMDVVHQVELVLARREGQ